MEWWRDYPRPPDSLPCSATISSATTSHQVTPNRPDAANIIPNPEVRHGISIDPELHFRPNLDDNKSRNKECKTRPSLHTLLKQEQDSITLWDQLSNLRAESPLFMLLSCIREVLLTFAPHDDRAAVDKVLNTELSTQRMIKVAVNAEKFAEYLNTLKQDCAPTPGETVDEACNTLIEATKKRDNRDPDDPSNLLLDDLNFLKLDTYRLPPGWQGITQDLGFESFLSNLNSRLSSSLASGKAISNRVSEWTIYGEVMGNSIAALPDSGADVCFISPKMARSLGLRPRHGTKRLVKLANGRELVSPGSVDVPWNFRGEEETFYITCWILPGCTYPIILGSKFLEDTKCLTTLRHRIRRRHVSAPRYVRLNLLGEGKQRLRGYLNGIPVAALPDTGSDIMVLSRDYASIFGLRVDSNPEDIVEVEFADGTTALSDGIIRDAIWSSGGHSIRCDFLVLDNLSVDVILSKDYLFEMDVFSECTAHLTEDGDIENLDVCGIRLIREFSGRLGRTLNQLEDDSIEDVISQDAFSPAMINREWARRDRIRDEIEALGENRRAEAEAAEAQRQEQWERAKAEHRRRWAQAQTPGNPQVSTTERRGSSHATPSGDQRIVNGSGDGEGPGQLAPPKSASRRLRWLKNARVSIPLLPLRRHGNSHTSENAD